MTKNTQTSPKCCEECSKSKFALKGAMKEKFNGICGLACDCHVSPTHTSVECKCDCHNQELVARIEEHCISCVPPTQDSWAKHRQRLFQLAELKPQILIDVIDSAYLAGLEAQSSTLREKILEIVENSRNVDEIHGQGIKECQTRNQVRANLLVYFKKNE